ncbi:MAG: amidohydrolase family protein [Anaerolineae bacterium]|nr:amidohydrolase family protein [Anaerolineae bacterium]
MHLFDCNASYGLLDVPPLQYAATPADLIAEMDFCSVAEALVTCAAQRCDSPLVGNDLVLEQTRDHPRLHPAWVLLPPQTEEQAPTVDAFIARMGEAEVRALWAFPARNKYLLNATTFGPVFEVLIERSIPLFFPLTEALPGPGGHAAGHLGWQTVDDLLSQFPRLTLVATDQSVWGQDRYFRPLIERYRNLYLDISTYEQGRGLEDFCRKYGPDRLLFGTHYPEVPMGGPVLNLVNADIGSRDKELIGAGNLSRLLQEVKL